MRLIDTKFRWFVGLLLGLWLGGAAPAVWAHQPGVSYLQLQYETNRLTGTLDMTLRDLEYTVGLDSDHNGAVTYQELVDHQPAIAGYVLKHLHFRTANGDAPLHVQEHIVASDNDGVYARVLFEVNDVPPQGSVEVEYRLFFAYDASHRGLAQLEVNGQQQVAVFSVDEPTHRFVLGKPTEAVWFGGFVREGVWHIWLGFDHLLFLIALLLPAVLWRNAAGQWEAATSFGSVLVNILKIITAFTVAHALSLTLAAFQLISLPGRVVESAIAATVVFAAFNNLRPVFHGRAWLMAFCFGIIHGFGFAAVLGALHLQRSQLVQALIGFNLGVELGQLAVVILFLPAAFNARTTWAYRKLALQAGSALVMGLAMLWFIERAFGIPLLPF